MRVRDAIDVVHRDVLPTLAGKQKIAVAALVDFAKTLYASRSSVAALHKAFFEHANQTELFGSPDDKDREQG